MALKARHRARRKGGPGERVFGCDLLEHLRQTGQEVPQVLRSCTEFVEQHGVVDGIYRLSGVASNIQRLRQEFDSDRDPDLSRPTYLQDIHCVSSLCKAYCRELPNPLLTFQLYHRFADAVATQTEEARLVKIKEVLKELPLPHYRTLEFLMRHLLRMAAHSSRTNMHARNLAIVWAPNLLRSRDIEATGFNGTAAFMEVRVQSIVVEFILTHVEQLFGDAPLHGDTVSPRRSLLLNPLGHVPATLSQGDGPPPIRPYHTIIELGDHRRKGSIKAKKWRSIFNLGRSSHEAKRKLAKAEEKGDRGGKPSLRPAKSMDSLSSDPFASDEHPGLSQTRSVKQPQRRESFGTCSVPDQSPEPPGGTEPTRDPEGERGASSEPSTPRGGRAAPLPPGRSPKAAGSRAEKCVGLHISGPFSVTVPFHITSNLSRLTRGLPCPALAQPPASPPPKDPQNGTGRDTEQSRLSLELRDSFAFLDSQEPWLEGAGDGEMSLSLLSDTGDSERSLAMEEGMESGFMNPGEPPTEQPPSYLSIEECMDEEMFFMAPSGSDPEDRAGDTDSDDMFLSAHDDLSPLVASLEPPEQPPGEGTAMAPPDPPSAPSTTGEQDRSAALGPAGLCPTDEEAPGDGEPPGGALAEWGAPGTGEGVGGVGAVGNGSVRTDSSSEDGPEGEAGETGSHEGAGPVPSMSDGPVEEDGAASSAPEEPGEGEPQPAPGSLPASSLEETPEEPAEPPDPKVSPKEAPEEPVEPPAPEVAPEEAPEEPAEPPDPETAPEKAPRLVLPAVARGEGSSASPGSSPGSPSLSASAPDLRSASPEAPEPTGADPPGDPGHPEPLAVLRHDGSAPARLAARSVRVQQARSVPVVPPKPQFARIPPALQPWGLPATLGEAAALSPSPPEGSPRQAQAAARRAGWREGGSASFDAAVAAEQQPPPAPVRRIQTYGGGEPVPAAPKALPFHRAPLRPRLPRPLSCAAAPEGRGPARSRRSLSRPGQDEGAALAAPRRAVGAEGAAGER